MSLASSITLMPLNKPAVQVYDPDHATTRRRATDTDGSTFDLAIIQSQPTKAGRQRQVIRITGNTAPNAAGKVFSTSCTLTFDRPVDDPRGTAGVGYGFDLLKGTFTTAIIQQILAGES